MNTPLISIIVPVYNSERYLCRCLDSILNQKLSEWECILIDDGSKDGSGKICDDYEGKDIRIKTYHVKNGGPSRARNIGLSHAKGIWVSFVDSDDWINPNFLSNMIENSKNTDIVFSSFTVHYQGKTMMPNTLDGVFVGAPFFMALSRICRLNLFGYTWLKLYRREVIETNRIRFDEDISYMEDSLFTWNFVCCVGRLGCVNVHDYQYNLNDTSISLRHRDALTVYNINKKIFNSMEKLLKRCDNQEFYDYCSGYKIECKANFILSCYFQDYSFQNCLAIMREGLIDEQGRQHLLKMQKHKMIYIHLLSSKKHLLATIILKIITRIKKIKMLAKPHNSFDLERNWKEQNVSLKN